MKLTLQTNLARRRLRGPQNETQPNLSGSYEQNDLLSVTPGTYTVTPDTLEYKILRGDVNGPSADIPANVILDWTTDESTPASGIEDGDYLWLFERATLDGVQTVTMAAAGHGPMVGLALTNASIIGTDQFNSASSTVAQLQQGLITIDDVPSRRVQFIFQCSGQDTSGAPSQDPVWSDVTLDGVAAEFVSRTRRAGSSGRYHWTEIWELRTKTNVHAGTDLQWQATRGVGKRSDGVDIANIRSEVSVIAIGNTGVAPSTANDYEFIVMNTSATTTYNFAGVTPSDGADKLAFVVLGGLFANYTGPLSYTGPAGWTAEIDPWEEARSTGSLIWQAIASKAIATPASETISYTMTDTVGGFNQRYGLLTTFQVAGNNA